MESREISKRFNVLQSLKGVNIRLAYNNEVDDCENASIFKHGGEKLSTKVTD